MEWMAPAVVFVGVIAIWVSVTQMQGRLERAERKLNALLRHFNIEPAQVRRFPSASRNWHVIPSTRSRRSNSTVKKTGVSLVEAKQAVEEFINSGCAMPDSVSLLMIEFLTWVSSRRRTYAESMDAWRSSCPRHTVWEDALVDQLIQIEKGDRLQQSEVILTPRGRAILDGGPGRKMTHT
jgi:hypothetical protein